jgi:hypothetical protein
MLTTDTRPTGMTSMSVLDVQRRLITANDVRLLLDGGDHRAPYQHVDRRYAIVSIIDAGPANDRAFKGRLADLASAGYSKRLLRIAGQAREAGFSFVRFHLEPEH